MPTNQMFGTSCQYHMLYILLTVFLICYKIFIYGLFEYESGKKKIFKKNKENNLLIYKNFYQLRLFRIERMGSSLSAGYKEGLANLFEGGIRFCKLVFCTKEFVGSFSGIGFSN